MKKLFFGALLVIIMLTIPPIRALAEVPKVPVVILLKKELAMTFGIASLKPFGVEIVKTYNIINGFAADIPEDKIEELKRSPLVASVDPDVEVRALDINADMQIRVDMVWAAGETGQGIPVAILDTGINANHSEFSGRILKCHNEIFSDPNTCDDQNGHGTHVAGIVGAAGSNPDAKGVAPAVSFYIDQVLDANGSGSLSGIIAGIDWSVTNGTKIINLSLGTGPISTTQPNCDNVYPSFTTAINNAVAAGVTVVAAAGNSGTQGVGAPGCISSTIAVAAVDSRDKIASFSSQGAPVADHGISAPGVSIFSSLPGGYGFLSGTSMATPHVSGTIALMLKANSSLTPADVRTILFSNACTTTTAPSCTTGTVPNSAYGHGRIDSLRAYTVAIPEFPVAMLVLAAALGALIIFVEKRPRISSRRITWH